MHDMEVVLLSQCPELLNECADLLNKQWKRSTSARVQSLERCFLELPDSLLLLEKTQHGTQVIGHSRLTKVLEDPYGCWIGSVVIKEDRRKRGYGKYIMQKTEEYAKALQFTTVYLNTQDQQGFYEHLGYIYCDPVSSISFSNNIILPKQILNFSRTDHQNKSSVGQFEGDKNCSEVDSDDCNSNSIETTSVPPSPPPPPPPFSHQKSVKCPTINNQIKSNLGQYWMKKKL